VNYIKLVNGISLIVINIDKPYIFDSCCIFAAYSRICMISWVHVVYITPGSAVQSSSLPLRKSNENFRKIFTIEINKNFQKARCSRPASFYFSWHSTVDDCTSRNVE
jgi:hypothetical protein